MNSSGIKCCDNQRLVLLVEDVRIAPYSVWNKDLYWCACCGTVLEYQETTWGQDDSRHLEAKHTPDAAAIQARETR